MDIAANDKADPAEISRRHFLMVSTASLGGFGLVATAIPFISSMRPSERARAAGAPTEVDFLSIPPGQLVTIEWRGKPVWVLHRTPAMLANLGTHDAKLVDPQAQANQ